MTRGVRTLAAAAALTASWGVAARSASTGAAGVVCEDRSGAATRSFALEPDPHDDQRWVLSLSTGRDSPPIRLPLPHARPSFDSGRAVLSYHSANGGLVVELDVAPQRASLEIYVNYELEVNVQPDLDPAVDALNTRGVLTTLECRISGATGPA